MSLTGGPKHKKLKFLYATKAQLMATGGISQRGHAPFEPLHDINALAPSVRAALDLLTTEEVKERLRVAEEKVRASEERVRLAGAEFGNLFMEFIMLMMPAYVDTEFKDDSDVDAAANIGEAK